MNFYPHLLKSLFSIKLTTFGLTSHLTSDRLNLLIYLSVYLRGTFWLFKTNWSKLHVFTPFAFIVSQSKARPHISQFVSVLTSHIFSFHFFIIFLLFVKKPLTAVRFSLIHCKYHSFVKHILIFFYPVTYLFSVLFSFKLHSHRIWTWKLDLLT